MRQVIGGTKYGFNRLRLCLKSRGVTLGSMSVPPAVAGGSMMSMRLENRRLTHPLPQVVLTSIQVGFMRQVIGGTKYGFSRLRLCLKSRA